MAERNCIRVYLQGFTFRFYFDDNGQLHALRYGAGVPDVLETFFEGQRSWDEAHKTMAEPQLDPSPLLGVVPRQRGDGRGGHHLQPCDRRVTGVSSDMAKAKYRDYQILGVERETDPQTLELLNAAEREEQESSEMRVNIRWNRDQVNVIKHAAKLLDVPYQVYIKQLVIKQAMADIQDAERALASVAESAKAPAR